MAMTDLMENYSSQLFGPSVGGVINSTNDILESLNSLSNPLSDYIVSLFNSNTNSSASGNADSFNADNVEQLYQNFIQKFKDYLTHEVEFARENREFNRIEAEKHREWQERLSNTAYQRAMEDMKRAGLNPILAYQQGGASVPGGSAASFSSSAGINTMDAYNGINNAVDKSFDNVMDVLDFIIGLFTKKYSIKFGPLGFSQG